jgi:hypothetical protein
VQAEASGTEFDDWIGIPVAYTDALDNPNGWIDVNNVQIANDNDNVYIRVTLHYASPIQLTGLSLAFDTDQSTATGFDIFGLGLVGSELGYQADWPFQQATGVYNTGIEGVATWGGDYLGLAVTFPFWDATPPTGVQMEWAIPRNLAIGPTPPGTPVFTGNSFDFVVYSDQGLGDVTDEVISYTFAANPGTPGDFDADNDVDGADFLKWQREPGVGTLAEWQTSYPTPPLTAAVVSVPEPSSLALVVLTALGLLSRRSDVC